MKLEIVSKNYKVSDRLGEILNQKLSKLDKYFPSKDVGAKINLTGDGKKARMEVSIIYYGNYIRSEAVGDTMYYAIDAVMPKLERQIIKYREKLGQKYKLPQVKKEDYSFVSDVPEERTTVTKVKKFDMESITVSEACENMELVEHDFYLFVNKDTGNVEAVYRRHDNTVGHLQPKMPK